MESCGAAKPSDNLTSTELNRNSWSWVDHHLRSTSRPCYPYPSENEFELKERQHFEWYDRQPWIQRAMSTSGPHQSSIPASYAFGPDDENILPSQAAFLPPDGGKLAWLQSLAGFFVVLNAQGLNMSFGIFQAYYEKVLLPDISSSRISWIGSVQMFFVFFMALLVGPAVQRGHFRICFHGGSAVLCLSILATSYCSSWWQLFIMQGLITGMAMGTIFASGLVVLISYFTTRLNVATGIAAAGAPAGGIIFPLVARGTVNSIGFGWTVRCFALINLLTMGVANLIVQEQKVPKIDSEERDARSTPSSFVPRDIPYLSMLLGMFFTYLGFFIAYYYIVLYGQEVVHFDETTAINLLLAMNGSNLVGRIMPAIISDTCLGPLNVLAPWTTLSSVFVFHWISAVDTFGIFLTACSYGFFSAAIQGLYTSTIVDFAGREGRNASKKIGLALGVIGIAVLVGSPIGGALISGSKGKYLHTQLFAGITLLIGSFFFFLARYLKCGWTPQKI